MKTKKTKKETKSFEHKFIGFHNTKEVVSTSGEDKLYAEAKCKELLLGYFHDRSKNCTRLPLECYNGLVAYVGEKWPE